MGDDTNVPETTQCPFCAEDIRAEAIKCKHCGEDLTKPRRPPTRYQPPGVSTGLKAVGAAILVAVALWGLMGEVEDDEGSDCGTAVQPLGPGLVEDGCDEAIADRQKLVFIAGAAGAVLLFAGFYTDNRAPSVVVNPRRRRAPDT